MSPVEVHPSRYPDEAHVPADIIGIHVGTPPETHTSTSPAPQLTELVPPEPADQLVIEKESMPVVIAPSAISAPSMKPLVIYPREFNLSTPSDGHPRAPLSTQIPPELRITFVLPEGDPSVVI